LAELSEKEEKDKPKPVTSKVLGGGGRGGRYPKELMDVFGGKTVPELLSRKNPGKLMNILNVTRPAGKDDFERLSNLVQSGTTGHEAMKNVYGNSVTKADGKGRSGLYVPVKVISNASGRLFIRELVVGAIDANYITLGGHVRVEITEGGVIIYPVKTTSERWGT